MEGAAADHAIARVGVALQSRDVDADFRLLGNDPSRRVDYDAAGDRRRDADGLARQVHAHQLLVNAVARLVARRRKLERRLARRRRAPCLRRNVADVGKSQRQQYREGCGSSIARVSVPVGRPLKTAAGEEAFFSVLLNQFEQRIRRFATAVRTMRAL
jgi:hypothetical protein